MNGRTPLYLTLLALALLIGAVLKLQPYTADWPGSAYRKPAERFVRTALHQDSAGLVRLSASEAAVAWALQAARTHPDSLGLWAQHTRAWTGERRGDTAQVFLFPPGDACEKEPIVFRFVGSGDQVRVLRASSDCFDSR